jgi:hypothetical protein
MSALSYAERFILRMKEKQEPEKNVKISRIFLSGPWRIRAGRPSLGKC